MADATTGQIPACPECGQTDARRVVSAPAVLGQLGGLTPQEQSAVKQVEEKMAAITPRSQIDQLQAHRTKSKPA